MPNFDQIVIHRSLLTVSKHKINKSKTFNAKKNRCFHNFYHQSIIVNICQQPPPPHWRKLTVKTSAVKKNMGDTSWIKSYSTDFVFRVLIHVIGWRGHPFTCTKGAPSDYWFSTDCCSCKFSQLLKCQHQLTASATALTDGSR